MHPVNLKIHPRLTGGQSIYLRHSIWKRHYVQDGNMKMKMHACRR